MFSLLTVLDLGQSSYAHYELTLTTSRSALSGALRRFGKLGVFPGNCRRVLLSFFDRRAFAGVNLAFLEHQRYAEHLLVSGPAFVQQIVLVLYLNTILYTFKMTLNQSDIAAEFFKNVIH